MSDHTHTPSCCASKKKSGFQLDIILHGCLLIIAASFAANLALQDHVPYLHHFTHTIAELIGQMWWGVLIGMIFVGIMSKIPRDYFNAVLGRGDSFGGILRAAAAGLMFDLCSHGILMIGAKLYERGASLAQVMTFLIASPWNSFSLTLILFSLIGIKWTLVFIVGSAIVAVITGLIINAMTCSGALPANPNEEPLNKDFDLTSQAKADLSKVAWNAALLKDIINGGKHEAQMLLRWLLLGMVMAAAIRTFIPTESFADWFGPTMGGLGLTMIATTIIEVCSEGSSPIAAELVNRASAPGNGFAFLMAGAATDYTEILVLRDTTKSWKMALAMPLVSVPQILLLGYLMNVFG